MEPGPPAAERTQDTVAPPVIDPTTPPRQRLWVPWRMRYVGGAAAEPGCLFCNRLAAADDVRSLILQRGQHAFTIMNLFPYNTGHVMLVPNQHVPSPEQAHPAALAEIATTVPGLLRALRRVLNCDGFNVGMNVGAVAGAGVATHLHQHVVPRWVGDANFMPILAATMVLPEMIPVTYAKLRAELAREAALPAAPVRVTAVLLAREDREVLMVRDQGALRLPSATPGADEPVWQAAGRALAALPGGADLAGWAGAARADAAGPLALAFRAHEPDPTLPGRPAGDGVGLLLTPVAAARRDLTSADDRAAVAAGLAHLAPSIAAP